MISPSFDQLSQDGKVRYLQAHIREAVTDAKLATTEPYRTLAHARLEALQALQAKLG
mgnify:CR=1 FL=1